MRNPRCTLPIPDREGTNGDPILIIRNGQGTQNEEGWVPTVEDINNDESSIYATSTQKIPLKASSTNYFSYKNIHNISVKNVIALIPK